ncbi:alpha-amylase, partial [Staphylotrichum tortipilum]
MSTFLNLPSPPLPPPLLALRAAATRQEPNSGYSSNLRPLRTRRTLAFHQPPPPSNLPDPCPVNETLLQSFEWHTPSPHPTTGASHWRHLTSQVPLFAKLGVTKLWLPPACKAAERGSNGYDVYDLWDLGEFEQKGARGTKWGVKGELVELSEMAEKEGVRVVFDAEKKGGEGEIRAWTGFEFGGRKGRYSKMKWGWEHFTGVDYDGKTGEKGVWRLEGKNWAEDVDEELGNYDFLMFADVDHEHPEVRADIFRWVEWLPHQLRLGGLRLDAIKHYSFTFIRDLVTHIRKNVDPDWFIVGEYWREDSEYLAKFIEFMGYQISLFDIQLVSNFSKVSLLGDKGDLRKVLDDSLILWKPDNAVTFVTNHDTTPVAPFFIPLAYSLILLRANSGLPSVFYADLFGPAHPPHFPNPIDQDRDASLLPRLLLARKLWAYGPQHDYFDTPSCVGFARSGHPSRARGAGLAVVMTNSWRWQSKDMTTA